EQAERQGAPFTEEDERALRGPILQQYERQGHPYYSSARLWDDGVIDPAQTRDVLGLAISASLNAEVEETAFGVFRMYGRRGKQMPFNTIQLEHHPQGHATLWLNRPARHNAFNAQMIDELLQALEQLQGNDRLRLLALRGRGRHFSAGADIEWMREAAALDYAANLRDAEALGELMYRLYQLPMPTLAVVQGAAFGGALGLIACCDLALGAEDAQLSLSEVRIGLAPAVISPYVVKAIGERATR